MTEHRSRPGPAAATGLTLPVAAAVAAFVVLAWLPLLLALGAGEEPGGWHEEAGIALGLVGVWLAAVHAWAEDESEDLGPTMAALDRALDRAEQIARTFRLLPGGAPEAAPDPAPEPGAPAGEA